MRKLWCKETEIRFFNEAMKFATPEQLFYVTDSGQYLAYWPKGYTGSKSTLQSRNSLIGQFTEKWTTDLVQESVKNLNLFAVQGAVCSEIGLSRNSPADVAICKNKSIRQEPQDILAIIEVKMSIVWNWQLETRKSLKCAGNYKTHQGNPGLLRSDSMLKAIGKAINIRVASFKGAQIPIIVLGNTPITNHYYSKVDHLKMAGIIQGFWSVNPNPLDNSQENIENTPKGGFRRFDNFDEVKKSFVTLLSETRNFFSSMKTKNELGKIIELANQEQTYERKAEVFLKLIRD